VNVFGRSGNVGFVAPYSVGHVEGFYIGEFTEVDRSGFRDPLVRFAFNLYGAPAMDLKGFAAYRQKTNLGLSLAAALPLGEYDPTKLINLGSNRFSLKPEIGLSHLLGKWTLEIYGGVWLFTDNDDFYGGKTREQAAIGSLQIHVLYTFKPRLWVAVEGTSTAGAGRRSTASRISTCRRTRDSERRSPILGPRRSLKVTFSRGAYTTIGADFTSLVVGYQYLWGAGF
jgi:hypothetical protein